ncbi:TatD family deoxyribonuclease [Corynebacterium sp. sy017]|uniref:TatD family hydrolase n=1 Tax=unclassified Corynebacterium TaxID=2624378 RepID=UPI0011864480|nr:MULTISPECIES: TatD family hydrolase [unclassified Corynebacterium]MBP3088867.1 TatD family deoxyribonuclease [Corynebacterium sp. sy017]TSD91208.1 TatD family deoxyribonuclease [Corynebacterium sp. SY003]
MGKKKPRPIPVPAPRIDGLIDAHTHLSSCAKHKGTEDIGDFVHRAQEAGVTKICTVGDGLAEAELALAAAREYENVYAACAIHPTRAQELDEQAKVRLEQMAADQHCVAIGETGLDTYWIKHDPDNTAAFEVQEEALRWHIDVAVRYGKALMIHNREADKELLRILDDEPKPVHTILHCFSSPLDIAQEAIDRGYVLSFAGNVTFKRNDFLREAARIVPGEQLLVETDAPFMTPEPYRGAKNEPALIGHTAHCIAELRGISVTELAQVVRGNFDRVYSCDS